MSLDTATAPIKRSNARQWGPFNIETRENPPSSWLFTLSMLSVLATLILTGVIFALYGQNPITAYVILIQGTLGDLSGPVSAQHPQPGTGPAVREFGEQSRLAAA